MPIDENAKKTILRRLRRVDGQVRGIIRMMEDDEECGEVLNQVAAARAALEKVGVHLIISHMKDCLKSVNPSSYERAVEEAVDSFLRFTSTFD